MKEPELGELPSISASRDNDLGDRSTANVPPRASGLRADVPERAAASGNGLLWALCAALTVALLGLGYWTHQQQSLLRQQLVATQNSFARISEEASGRIQDITGKVSATEDSLGAAEQDRKAQLERIEDMLQAVRKEQGEYRQQLAALQQADQRSSEQATTQQTAIAALQESTMALQEDGKKRSDSLAALQQQFADADKALQQMQTQLGTLSVVQLQLGQQAEQLDELKQGLTALQNKGNNEAVQQAVQAMRAELDRRQAANDQALQAIDSFRLQTNRSLNTLQSQVAALHAQVEGN
ncbi:hypothetical protein [Halopseudomonas oceani]|uniref:hypothetical protein n=1 Tax=Halopseudomonas oceani TaxID=1708783 RepID=UPI002AA66C6E|nr:hypothetical protein [Halopseudomonas oceani]